MFSWLPCLSVDVLAASSVDVDDVVSWIEDNTKSFTLSLNDDSFEHETQASTGATTGDWFVCL